MIPADHFHDNGDGTAWVALAPCNEDRRTAAEGHECALHYEGLDRPCDTCRGRAWACPLRHYPHRDGCPTCPDCDGTGRHTFTVEVESVPHQMWERSQRWYVHDHEQHCTLRVSVVPDMVLLIHDHDNLLDGDSSLDHDWQPHITVSADRALLCVRDAKYTDDWDERPITLPPAAAPGMWAVKLAVRS